MRSGTACVKPVRLVMLGVYASANNARRLVQPLRGIARYISYTLAIQHILIRGLCVGCI
jgi:hypothetical protein